MTFDSSDLTLDALCKISTVDRDLIGTKDYIGVSFFLGWTHPMSRDLMRASISKRRAVHNALLDDGLDLDGDTGNHRVIIKRILGGIA